MRRMVVAGAAVVVVAVMPIATAVASGPSWSPATPASALRPQGSLVGVSCATATDCIAVGSDISPAGAQTGLAEHWDGSAWTVSVIATPARALSTSLSAVSCLADGTCAAAGQYVNAAGGQVPLAERWDGSAWSVQSTPKLSGTNAILDGIACSSSSACTAVGHLSHSGTTTTLTERWNGASWSLQSTPNPAGAASSVLTAVACAAAAACTAVGVADGQTLAAGWDGTSWNIQPTPNPGIGRDTLSGVSCSAAAACTAVGSYATGKHTDATLALRWDGSAWTQESTPNTAGTNRSYLAAVTCRSAQSCNAVGFNGLSIAETWDGTSWSVSPVAQPAGSSQSGLAGVACPARNACRAVGWFADRTAIHLTLVETGNGAGWTPGVSPTRDGAVSSELDDVACPSTTMCMAVGHYSPTAFSAPSTPLAERWDGAAWSEQVVPSQPGSFFTYLTGVACTSVVDCIAVGTAEVLGNTFVPVAAHWNGTDWTLQDVPAAAGAVNTSLQNVSCTAATACTAVGSADGGSTQSTVAERWNGATWTIQVTPNPSGVQRTQLIDVSCTTSTTCAAVGVSQPSAGSLATVAEAWDGTAWSIQATPPQPGGILAGISCESAAACVAVGWDPSGPSGISAVAERWDGTSWTALPVLNVAGAVDTQLLDLECSSATDCVAVGSSGPGCICPGNPLAEHWDGASWVIQSTPSPPGTKWGDFTGVSCSSASTCMAVGTYTTLTPMRGPGLGLAERFS